MPWWNREVVQRRRLQAGATPSVVLSDPSALGDGLRADAVRGFVEVEALSALAEVRVYRLGGASASALDELDASPYVVVKAPEVAVVDWPQPPPAFLCTRLELVRTGGAGQVTGLVRVVQIARRDT